VEYDLKFQNNLNNARPTPTAVAVTGGAATYDAGARSGERAIKLSGANSIQLDTAAAPVDYNQSFTVAFWIKVLSVKGSDPPVFSNKDWADGKNNGFQIMVKNGAILLNSKSVADSGRLNGDADVTVAASSLVGTPGASANWVHIAVVYDKEGGVRGAVRCYANGARTNNSAVMEATNLTQGISGGQRSYIANSMASGSYGPLYNGASKSYNVEFLMQDFLLVGGAYTDAQVAALAVK
jgi:hypothetical protein